MRGLLVGTVVFGALAFLFFYVDAKARAYRVKMDLFAAKPAVESAAASAPSQDAAEAGSHGSVEGDAAVDHDEVDAGGEAMRMSEGPPV